MEGDDRVRQELETERAQLLTRLARLDELLGASAGAGAGEGEGASAGASPTARPRLTPLPTPPDLALPGESGVDDDRAWLERIAELTPDVVFVRDLVAARDTAANRSLADVLGYGPGELEDADSQQLVHPDDRERRTDRLKRLGRADDGEIVSAETRLLHKDGEWRWFLHRWLVLRRNADGTPRLALCVASDITDHRRALEALRDSRSQLAVTVEAINDGLIACDAEGAIRLFNRAAEELSGKARDEVIGREPASVLELVDALGARVDLREIASRARRSEEPRAEPLTLRARRGVEHTVELRATALHGGSEELGTLIVLRDISARHRLEAQVRQAQKMETVGRLAGGVAHDFNNLLAGILGYGELLQLRLESESPHLPLVSAIVDAGRRAAELTDKLLAISRKGRRTCEPVDIHALIGEATGILARTVDRRISIEREQEAEHAIVMGDPTQLQSALLNLALNARDAISAAGTIAFRTRNDELTARACRDLGLALSGGRVLVIEVVDNGIGIPAEDQQRIFEPFFTTKPTGRGAGLGLAAVYGCLTEHGGAIRIDSAPGSGTTIALFLPLAKRQDPLPDSDQEIILQGEGTVLVVDDEAMIREMGREMLCELGYDVVIAESGRDAIACYEARPEEIDLVLLDLVMPDLDGQDTFYALRRLDPEVRVLLASGFNFDANVEDLLADGAAGFVHKPFRTGELSWRIAAAIGPPVLPGVTPDPL